MLGGCTDLFVAKGAHLFRQTPKRVFFLLLSFILGGFSSNYWTDPDFFFKPRLEPLGFGLTVLGPRLPKAPTGKKSEGKF